ncbi:MAG TPA: DUF4386 domain-containing protein [Candidatus Paenibacillus intestinavium]|nr:DUF4386 domain-containing protein [Candidatus Paenibacillus intestinavium]
MITRTNEKIIGGLFLLATVVFMIGSSLLDSHLAQSDYLSHIHLNRMEVLIALFLELINSAAVVGIAILLFPLLKHHNESIALGYLSSRIIESVLLIVGIICPLVLLTLSEAYTATGDDSQDYYINIGNMLIKGQDMSFELAMLVLGLGSLMFCYLLYRKRLIPRPLSLLGIVGYITLMASSCLTIIGFDPGFVLFIPGGVFEVLFPIWLITKGFYRTK